MSKEDNKYLIISKNAAIVLIATVVICLTCWKLGEIQAISDFSYRLHELFYLTVNIGIFFIPVEAVLFICFFIRWLIELRKDKTGLKKNIILNSIAMVSLLVYTLYFVYSSYGVQTSGVFQIVNKEKKDNKYYVLVKDKKLKCTRSEYNLITEGKEYLLSFDWNKLDPQKGDITYIEAIKK